METGRKLTATNVALGVQHLFAMFGATVLVPILTGMNISMALVCAGIGTLLFHFVTGRGVPVFLGSSFAFIPAVAGVVAGDPQNIPRAQGGIVAAGVLYLAFAVLAHVLGADRVRAFFPPVVTGPVIVVIGVGLSYVAVNNSGLLNMGKPAGEGGINWLIALFVVAVIVALTVFSKGFFRLVPILIGIGAGYFLCVILHLCGVLPMDFSGLRDAPWLNIPFVTRDAGGASFFSWPVFDAGAVLSIAPVALVTFMEHIGDITTNGAVVGRDFLRKPGLHRTLLGDGLATALAGLFGGPANTTYSENTGVLAATKNYNPFVLEIAAVFAVLLGFVGKFGAFLNTIPAPVMGGVGLILFGMIAAIGMRTITEAALDFTRSRNLIIVALILVLGLGITIATYLPDQLAVAGIPARIGGVYFNFSGLFVAVVVGVLANLLLPRDG